MKWARKQRPDRGVSQFTAPEASFFQDGRHYILQGRHNRTIGSDVFLDIYAGWGSPPFLLTYQDGVGGATSRLGSTDESRIVGWPRAREADRLRLPEPGKDGHPRVAIC